MPHATIRPYARADRAAVRAICCETADRGDPVEHFFGDREVFADLLTSYYTDCEPRSAWVAEADGQVIGYLTGCRSTRRYRRIFIRRIVPAAVSQAVGHGLLWRAQTWRLAAAGLRTWRLGGLRRLVTLDRRYPAHLHLNLQRAFRGQGLGCRLIERFTEQVREARLPGIHATVRADNIPSCRLFERMGFQELDRRPAVLPYGTSFRPHETIIYGKAL